MNPNQWAGVKIEGHATLPASKPLKVVTCHRRDHLDRDRLLDVQRPSIDRVRGVQCRVQHDNRTERSAKSVGVDLISGVTAVGAGAQGVPAGDVVARVRGVDPIVEQHGLFAG